MFPTVAAGADDATRGHLKNCSLEDIHLCGRYIVYACKERNLQCSPPMFDDLYFAVIRFVLPGKLGVERESRAFAQVFRQRQTHGMSSSLSTYFCAFSANISQNLADSTALQGALVHLKASSQLRCSTWL